MNPCAWNVCVFVSALLCMPISGCSEPTVGQQFRDILAEIDAKCRKEGLGPYLSPGEPPGSRKRTDSSCEILKIKPVDPLATEEGRFAYSLKLPPPHDKPKVEYKKGMSAEVYFKELCEKEAGEWIFKTVEGVEGVFQGRQNIPPRLGLPFAYQMYEMTEMQTRTMEDLLVQPNHGRFDYMERPLDPDEFGNPYVRFYRGTEVIGHWQTKARAQKNRLRTIPPYIVNREQVDTLKSRYAFTWRQIRDADALELGITGGETIIYDLTTKEVLAYRRFFSRVWLRPDSKSTRITNSEYCQPGFTKGVWPFIQRVLVPINPSD